MNIEQKKRHYELILKRTEDLRQELISFIKTQVGDTKIYLSGRDDVSAVNKDFYVYTGVSISLSIATIGRLLLIVEELNDKSKNTIKRDKRNGD